MKEEILEKAKIENLRTKIYLMIITLDLNLIEDNTEEAYNQDEDLSEVFYCNKMENPNEDYENNENFENLDNEKNISKRSIDENCCIWDLRHC